MPMPNSVTDHQDRTNVKTIRQFNRAGRARESAIQNVVERLEVFGVLWAVQSHASDAPIHPKVTREHAERLVEAVLALTKTAREGSE